jgi:hypothetical protein
LRTGIFGFSIADVRSTGEARPAAVAGLFYPAGCAALRSQVADCLRACGVDPAAQTGRAPKLVIVPHAGYDYSGATAARAYSLLARGRDRITRVVLLGPAHRCAVRALALPQAQAFETPLGRVPLDLAALQQLAGLTQIERSERAHAGEHSLEVQLPFLQTVLDRFALVPVLVGDATASEVAQLLDRLWGGDETCIVVSSDLSHYLSRAQAQEADRATARRILDLDARLEPREACGAIPVNGALLAARRHALVPRVLGLTDSGEVTGDLRRVVGYGAFAFDPATAS